MIWLRLSPAAGAVEVWKVAGSGNDTGDRLLALSAVSPGPVESQPEQWPKQGD